MADENHTPGTHLQDTDLARKARAPEPTESQTKQDWDALGKLAALRDAAGLDEIRAQEMEALLNRLFPPDASGKLAASCAALVRQLRDSEAPHRERETLAELRKHLQADKNVRRVVARCASAGRQIGFLKLCARVGSPLERHAAASGGIAAITAKKLAKARIRCLLCRGVDLGALPRGSDRAACACRTPVRADAPNRRA